MGLTKDQGLNEELAKVWKFSLPVTCWNPSGVKAFGIREASASERLSRVEVQALTLTVAPLRLVRVTPDTASPGMAPEARSSNSPCGEGKRLSCPTTVTSPPNAVLLNEGSPTEATVR